MEEENEITIDVDLLLTAETKKKKANCTYNKVLPMENASLQEAVSLNCEIKSI